MKRVAKAMSNCLAGCPWSRNGWRETAMHGGGKTGFGGMNMPMRTILLCVLLGFSPLPVMACFSSITLGTYNLGEWSGVAGGTAWKVSDTVGSASDTASSAADLESQKNTLIGQCDTKGNALIAGAKSNLLAKKNALGADFDKTCDDPFCQMFRETFRSLWIESEGRSIDNEIDRMAQWYTNNISLCKQHFTGRYNTLQPHMCQ